MLAMCILTVAQGVKVWPLILSVVVLSLAILLTVFTATTATIFRLHRLNFAGFASIGVLLLVFEFLLTLQDTKGHDLTLAHTGNIGGALILLATGLVLLIPSTMSVSQNIHPFVLGGSKKTRKSVSPQNAHREVQSVFEDWPDPEPFPVTTLYNFQTTSASELVFNKGENLVVLDCRGNWWQAQNPRTSAVGFVPSNFVQVLQKAKVTKRHLASSDDEASIQEGQVVEVMEHHELLSLVRTVEGKIGSVPTACLEVLPDAAIEKLKL